MILRAGPKVQVSDWRLELLPGCSMDSNEEILFPQQKPENLNQHTSDTAPNLQSFPWQELNKPGRVFPAI